MGFRLTLNRRHSLSGRDNLDWFFANRKWIRIRAGGDAPPQAVTECAWAKRSIPPGEAGIRFLLLASKRFHKRAHDRNKIRRWLRAAITATEEFSRLEEAMLARGEQLLVMMRISMPVRDVKWADVREDVRRVAEHLKKRVKGQD